jgi:hypothetical protein
MSNLKKVNNMTSTSGDNVGVEIGRAAGENISSIIFQVGVGVLVGVVAYLTKKNSKLKK